MTRNPFSLRKRYIAGVMVGVGLLVGLTACMEDDAEVASKNVSNAADNFEVGRRIVVFNGITDKYLMEIVGVCSINAEPKQL